MNAQAVSNKDFLADPVLLTSVLSTLSNLYERNPDEVGILQSLLRDAITNGPKPISEETFSHLADHIAHAVPLVMADPRGRAALDKLTANLAAVPSTREIIFGAPLPPAIAPAPTFVGGLIVGGLIVIGIAAAGTYLYCSLGPDPAPGESAPTNC